MDLYNVPLRVCGLAHFKYRPIDAAVELSPVNDGSTYYANPMPAST